MVKDVIETHVEIFDDYPDVLVSCPARFNLFGEWAWFFRDKTISMAVNLPVYVSISLREDSTVRFVFPQLHEKKRANVTTLKFRKEDRWANAVKAMIFSYQALGIKMKGMNVMVYSQILPSAGLGITTAVKIASAAALKQCYGIRISDDEFMRVVESGSKQFLNARMNKGDIFSVLHAKKHCCVVTDYQKNTWTQIPFHFDGYVILLTDSRVPRSPAWDEERLTSPENYILLGELKTKKQGAFGGWVYETSSMEINEVLDVAGEDVRKHLAGVIKEHKLTLDALDSLKAGDFSRFARAVNHSHDLMRDVFTLSCPEIDWLVKRVQEIQNAPPGAHLPRVFAACSRITGKGFGRCTYTIIKKKDASEYREKLADYDRIFGYHPLCYQVESSAGIVFHRL
jgi:galactokinase